MGLIGLLLLFTLVVIVVTLCTKRGGAIRTVVTGGIGLLFFFGVIFTSLYAFVRVSEPDGRHEMYYRASTNHPTEVLHAAELAPVWDASSTSSVNYPSSDGQAEPEWVDAPVRRRDGDYQATASVGPYATREECEQALDVEIRRIANEYVDGVIGEEGAGARMQISAAEIRQHAVRDLWEEKIQASFGPMLQLHALLKFDGKHRSLIESHYRDLVVQGRLRQTGLWSALVLAVLGICFTYFKLDTATRGYYSGRLKTVAAAVILTLAGGAIYAARGDERGDDRRAFLPALLGAVSSPFESSAMAQTEAPPEADRPVRRCGPWRPRWID